MIIVEKKTFLKGAIMAVLFFVVLAFMFTPNFGDGRNAFEASDELFNSISKGSTNYFERLKTQSEPFKGKSMDVVLKIADAKMAEDALKVLQATGAKTVAAPGGVALKSDDMDQIISACLKDAEDMFNNKGTEVSGRYSIPEKEVLYTWWVAFNATIKAFNGQKRFKEAAYLEEVLARGVAVGYNYYTIEPEDIFSKAGIIVFALVFYVFYTLWWGFAVFFLAEGIGLQLTGGHKEET